MDFSGVTTFLIKKSMPSQQLVLDLGLVPSPSFEHFSAHGNEQPWLHLRETTQTIVERPPNTDATATPQPPTYIWGDTATGKTHLLQAIVMELNAAKIPFGWMNMYSKPNQEYDNDWAVILFDDAHLYDTAQQEQAFKWFVNAMHPASGIPRWVVGAGALPVTDLHVREDLRTRLGWGITWHLKTLDDAARKIVLQKQAKDRGLVLSNEVISYLLTHFARDLRSLSGLLGRLDTYALEKKRAITVPLLKTMLAEEQKAEETP